MWVEMKIVAAVSVGGGGDRRSRMAYSGQVTQNAGLRDLSSGELTRLLTKCK